ncbi:MAG: hypothetical protein U0996_26210 [Planctomycetaceae bacterium]
MSDPLYIRLGQTVRGPYSLEDLRELAGRGGFSKAHEVSTDKKSWTSASARPELFPEANRPQALERKQRGVESMSAEVDESQDSSDSVRKRSEKSDWSNEMDHAPAGRPIAVQTVLALVAGPIGFLLLLVSTAMVVLRLRVGSFVPSDNIGLIAMLGINLLLGVAAVIMGHLAIIRFHQMPGTAMERNLIVVGLSCGYTILILCLLFTVVLLISAVA